MRTAAEFRARAAARRIARWDVHRCKFCGYRCGFVFAGDRVFFDHGCDCVREPPRPTDWVEVAEHYNEQTDPHVIAEMDAFWGFAGGNPAAPPSPA